MRLLYLIISILVTTTGFTSNSKMLINNLNDMDFTNLCQKNIELESRLEVETDEVRQNYRRIRLKWHFEHNQQMCEFLNNNNCIEIFLNDELLWSKPCTELNFELDLDSKSKAKKVFTRLIQIPYNPNLSDTFNHFKVGYQTLTNQTFKPEHIISGGHYARRLSHYDHTQHTLNSFVVVTPDDFYHDQKKLEKNTLESNEQLTCFYMINHNRSNDGFTNHYIKAAPYKSSNVNTIHASERSLKEVSLLFLTDDGLNLSCQVRRLY